MLDLITSTIFSAWQSAADVRHNHGNKSVLDTITSALVTSWNSAVAHISNKSNPHNVTKSQVGLGNVPNMSAADMVKSAIGSSRVIKAVPPEYIGNMPTKYCVFVILWDQYDYDGQWNSNIYAYTMDLETGTRYRAVQDSEFDFSKSHTWTTL